MKEYTITQLNNFIKNVFDDEYVLNNIQVVGELIEFNIAKGNTFFVLTDSQSSISCMSFGALPKLEVGSQVLAMGAIKFYSKTGQVRFVAHTLKPTDTEGAKYAKFVELRDRLKKQGFFDNRLPLPTSVSKLALVTSIDGAVLHDFLGVANKLNTAIDIVICPCKVQGDGSEQSVAQAIHDVNNMPVKPACIVLMRGGGSTVDLDTFNQEQAVMAVVNSKIPIISAIGHEINYTLCDFVASARAGTPSIAAQMIVPDLIAIKKEVLRLASDMQDSLQSIFYKKHNQLSHLLQSIIRYNSANLNTVYTTILRHTKNMSNTMDKIVLFKQTQLQQLSIELDQNNPSKLLTQGYAKLQKDTQNINSISNLNKGDQIKIYMSDGQVDAEII